MTYLFAQYWIFIALAATLGMFVGWATCGGAALGDWRDDWYGWGIAYFLLGLFVAILKWLPGLPGHLLEIALLLFGAYILGCICGCHARWGFPEPAPESLRPARSQTATGVAPAIAVVAPVAAVAAAAPSVAGDIFSIDSSASYPGARPDALAGPRGGKADDLTKISGVDAGTAKALGDIGIFHHAQIGAWVGPQIQWVEHHLAHIGRIGREDWIAQARRLAGLS
jgi:predicted flap endonuclease-1-like 5' DNA nuclease